jgi:hypothetical protein
MNFPTGLAPKPPSESVLAKLASSAGEHLSSYQLSQSQYWCTTTNYQISTTIYKLPTDTIKMPSILPHVPKPKNHVPVPKVNLITDAERVIGFQKIESLITELARDPPLLPGSQPLPPIQIVGKTKDDIGTDTAKTSSIDRYRRVWKGNLDFLIYMEKYDSAQLLHRQGCPRNPLPVSSEAAILYMKYHVLKKDTIVTHHLTNQPVLSPKNNLPLKAVGDWKSASTLGIYRSALSKLHHAYKTTDCAYQAGCERCAEIPLAEIRLNQGCHLCLGQPQYWSKGCVTTCNDFKKSFDMLKDYTEEHYEARSTVAFLPGELRKIRRFLLSQNTVRAMMLWVMILVGTKLFLRIDEVLNLQMEAFLPHYFVVKSGDVVSLLVEIKGKRDKQKIHFNLTDDDVCPEFSPVRMVLTFLAITGRKTGYLFPTLSEINAESPTKAYEYDNMLSDMRYLCQVVLQKDLTSTEGVKLIPGTHTLRKTGFLLAYWGKKTELMDLSQRRKVLPTEDEACILLDARHKDGSGTMTYLADSATFYSLNKRLGMNDPSQKVGPYIPIYIKTLANLSSIANEGDVTNEVYSHSLDYLAAWYVRTVLGVPNSTDLSNIVSELCEKACRPRVDEDADTEVMYEAMREHLPPGIFTWMKNMLDRKLLNNNVLPDTDNNRRAATHVSPERTNLVETSVDYRAMFNAAATKVEKVGILLLGYDEIKQQMQTNKKLQGPLKSWGYKAASVIACLNECHDGSAESFIDSTPDFTLKKYTCVNKTKHRASFR